MECEQQLPCLAEEVDPLVIEKDIHLQFLEPPERHQKIHAVASETADGLGIDHVDLPRLTVGQEALEARTRADGPTRLDVGIGTDIFPSGIIQDVLLLEIHLGREAVQLSFHLCANTTVQGDPETLEMSPSWDDMYDGFSLLVGHDLSFVTRFHLKFPT